MAIFVVGALFFGLSLEGCRLEAGHRAQQELNLAMTYTVDTEKKKRYFYRFFIIILLVDIVIALIAANRNQLDNDKFVVVLFGMLAFTFIFYLGPLLILYINYLNANKRDILVITEDLKMILINDKSEQEFHLSDVQYLEFHLSKTAYEKRMKWFFWDELFYYRMILKNGNTVIISCLLSDDIHKHFSDTKIRRVMRLFPWIKTSS